MDILSSDLIILNKKGEINMDNLYYEIDLLLDLTIKEARKYYSSVMFRIWGNNWREKSIDDTKILSEKIVMHMREKLSMCSNDVLHYEIGICALEAAIHQKLKEYALALSKIRCLYNNIRKLNKDK